MVRKNPAHLFKLLAWAGLWNRQLDEAQSGELRKSMWIDDLCRRVAYHGGVEVRIAPTTGVSGAHAAIAHADQSKRREAAGVVGIDQQQQHEQQRAETKEHAAEHGEPPPPLARRLRSGSR